MFTDIYFSGLTTAVGLPWSLNPLRTRMSELFTTVAVFPETLKSTAEFPSSSYCADEPGSREKPKSIICSEPSSIICEP